MDIQEGTTDMERLCACMSQCTAKMREVVDTALELEGAIVDVPAQPHPAVLRAQVGIHTYISMLDCIFEPFSWFPSNKVAWKLNRFLEPSPVVPCHVDGQNF